MLAMHDDGEEAPHGSGHQKRLVEAPLPACTLVSQQWLLGLSAASSVGSVPESWLLFRARVLRLEVSRPNCEGTVPVSWSPERSRRLRLEVSRPNCEGTVPESWLLSRCRSLRLEVSRPNCEGTVPPMEFALKAITVAVVKSPTSVGSEPPRLQ